MVASANEGYRCYLVAYDEGDGVVVMINGDNGGQLASRSSDRYGQGRLPHECE